MIRIRQLQVVHDPLQDRLLLRVATPADEEYRAWLTRRFLHELWPALMKLVPPPAAQTAPAPAPTGGATSFEQPFRDDNANYPLGTTPLLVNEIKLDRLVDGNLQLLFREGRERHFQIVLTPDLLHVFCAMLRSAAGKADWQLALDYGTPAVKAAPTAPPPSRLH